MKPGQIHAQSKRVPTHLTWQKGLILAKQLYAPKNDAEGLRGVALAHLALHQSPSGASASGCNYVNGLTLARPN